MKLSTVLITFLVAIYSQQELKEAFEFLLGVVIGVSALISYLSQKEKITVKRILASLCMGLFVGFGVKTYAVGNGWTDNVVLASAIGAFLSESIIYLVYKYRDKAVLKFIFKEGSKEEKTNEEE